MVNAHVCVYAHSTHVVQYFTDWGNMDIFVSGNVLGSDCWSTVCKMTVKMVTTFTQYIILAFLLLKYPGFWLATVKITTMF